jgi:hypothetical protein
MARLNKRLTTIEQAVNTIKPKKFRIPYKTFNNLSAVEKYHLDDHMCMNFIRYGDTLISIVGEPNKEKINHLYDDLLHGKISMNECREEVAKLETRPDKEGVEDHFDQIINSRFVVTDEWLESNSLSMQDIIINDYERPTKTYIPN